MNNSVCKSVKKFFIIKFIIIIMLFLLFNFKLILISEDLNSILLTSMKGSITIVLIKIFDHVTIIILIIIIINIIFIIHIIIINIILLSLLFLLL